NVLRAQANSMGNTLQFDIYNEPDYPGFWPYNTTDYPFPSHFYDTWKSAYLKIRALQPNAIIVGPSFSNNDGNKVQAFLDWAKLNSVVPDIVSWHFGDIATDVANVRTKLTSLGLTRPIQISEYVKNWAGSNEQYVGKNAWLIAQLERAKVDAGIHAIWVNTTTTDPWYRIEYGHLGGIVTPSPANLKKGAWWLYKGYGDINGKILTTTPGTSVDVIAGKNTTPKYVHMLLGAKEGFKEKNVKIKLNNLTSTFTGTIHVRVEKVPENNGGAVNGNVLIYDKVFTIVSNKVNLIIPWDSDRDAYVVHITQ
ncbi:MAG: hypothetical protein ABIN95_01480, partial [Mucilaginibacter sp.]